MYVFHNAVLPIGVLNLNYSLNFTTVNFVYTFNLMLTDTYIHKHVTL